MGELKRVVSIGAHSLDAELMGGPLLLKYAKEGAHCTFIHVTQGRLEDPNATEEQLWKACRAACADEFLERMPDGLDTDLGQGGVNVSGGQKQRLCIARAILKKPKVLILDDSTSAVDTATDAKIRQAFRQDLPGTTKLIIAQRVTSVMDADLILVMDNGTVAAQGTHEELIKTCDIYREVYESQQEGVSIGG